MSAFIGMKYDDVMFVPLHYKIISGLGRNEIKFDATVSQWLTPEIAGWPPQSGPADCPDD